MFVNDLFQFCVVAVHTILDSFSSYPVWCVHSLKVMLHGTICNDDFQRNTALQCWNNVTTIRNNRDFKQIATATSTCTAVVDAVSWGEYVS